jgi:DNA-binding MarR family transcriptional regulator
MGWLTMGEVGAVGEVQWLDDEERLALFSLMRTTKRLLQTLDQELQTAHGLGLLDYEILVGLAVAGCDGLRMNALADLVQSSPSRLTHRLDRLVEDGLVERAPCSTDRRGSNALLTPLGRDRIEEVAPTHVDGLRRLFTGPLEREDLRALAVALEKIRATLGDERPPMPGMQTIREHMAEMPDRAPA